MPIAEEPAYFEPQDATCFYAAQGARLRRGMECLFPPRETLASHYYAHFAPKTPN